MNSDRVIRNMKCSYDARLKQRIRTNIESYRIKYHDWTFSKYAHNLDSHLDIAESMRKSNEERKKEWEEQFPI